MKIKKKGKQWFSWIQKSSLTYWRSTTENVFKKTGNRKVEVRNRFERTQHSGLVQQDDVEALVFGLKWSQK